MGRQLFGGNYLIERKGMFWGLIETRPFMRCLQQYADCLHDIEKVKECVAVMEELIALNPNDNQGVREQLLLYLIELNEDKKFRKYVDQYKEDGMAFALFTRALFAFKTEGESDNANALLKNTLKQNKFVAPLILSSNLITSIPATHGYGDRDEATVFVHFAKDVWVYTNGALEWLMKMSGKK